MDGLFLTGQVYCDCNAVTGQVYCDCNTVCDWAGVL